jgi:glycosyltransferase involved in cell wall biosynthesis
MRRTKKALLYNPYLDTLGGGELHALSIMKIFSENGIETDILWDDPSILTKIETQFALNLTKVKIIPNFLLHTNQIEKYNRTGNYDILLYVTDGSYFFSRAKRNYIYAMYPQDNLFSKGFIDNLKLKNFSLIANSKFAASLIRKITGREVEVLYPFIQDNLFAKDYSKDKIILNVGRFFKHLHSKRQDIIIKSFKELKQKSNLFKDFKLYLIGGLKEEDKDYFTELKELANGDPNILFFTNVSNSEILSAYKKAMYYWHAAGFGIEEEVNPHLVEHLGIAPLEAMAARCITFCHNSGGAKEIIEDGVNGFRYEEIDELIRKTNEVNQSKKIEVIVSNAQDFVKKNFSYQEFQKHVITYFNL